MPTTTTRPCRSDLGEIKTGESIAILCGGHRTLYPSTATRWIPFHRHSLGPQIPAVTWLSLTGISAPPRDPNNNNDEGEED
jgi:hypothetical protein